MSKPTHDAIARFLSKTTGKSYENALQDLKAPKIGRIGEKPKPLSFGFDYRSLINPCGKPSTTQVADFMCKQTGCSYESAFLKLNMLKPTRLK